MKNNPLFQRVIFRLLMVGWFAVSLAGCLGTEDAADTFPTKPDPSAGDLTPADLKLTSFQSCSEVVQKVQEVLKKKMEGYYKGLEKSCRFERREGHSMGEAIPTSAPSGDSAGASSGDFTTTNIQEEGVDEADIVKTDGRFLYALDKEKKELRVTQLRPFDQLKEVTRVPIEGSPHSLYLAGDKLVLFSELYPPLSSSKPALSALVPPQEPYTPPQRQRPNRTKITIFSVSDPTKPALERQWTFEGTLVSSRRRDHRVYLILQSRGKSPQLNYYDLEGVDLPDCSATPRAPSPTLVAAINRLRDENLKKIEAIRIDEIFPNHSLIKDNCRGIVRANASSGLELSTIVSFDLREEKGDVDVTSILSDTATVYASLQSLILGSRFTIAEDKSNEVKTLLHRFDLSLKSKNPVYTGTNAVKGTLLNQFSLSEDQGVLRVATTDSGAASSQSYVWTLDATKKDLSLLGKVEGLGKGERIYAVRFAGPRAFVVTFRQVDPLYVIDLKDPKNPTQKGELKVPGFSTYLHIFDEDHLIGLGQGDNGQGLQLSLFDVSSSSDPKALQQIKIGARGTSSDAVFDHHAFTFDRRRNLLVLPINFYEGDRVSSNFGTFRYAGYHLYDVSIPNGFRLRETIQNQRGPRGEGGLWFNDAERRSIVIGEGADAYLVTITKEGVQLYRIEPSLALVGEVSRTKESATKMSCVTDSDCVRTKRRNIPTSKLECVCDMMCYGELVNVAERNAREKAYNDHCGGRFREGDSFPGCPIAGCVRVCLRDYCKDNQCTAEGVACPK